MEKAIAGNSLYQKTLPLAPGRYRLNIAAKDVIGGGSATYETVLDVPQFREDQLTASSLILADVLERVPARSTGASQFVIGAMKVRPRLSVTFSDSEKLGIYVQIYHFAPGLQTSRANGTIEYEIVKNGTDDSVLSYTEDVGTMEGSASQVTVQKWLPLRGLAPGMYMLRMKVTDRNRDQTINLSAPFTVM
jgi:hypothetical protein